MEVKLGKERTRAGDGASHEVREAQSHPGGQRPRVGAAEGEPGGQVVLVIHAGDEVGSILQPLSGAQELHIVPAHVGGGVAGTIVSTQQ